MPLNKETKLNQINTDQIPFVILYHIKWSDPSDKPKLLEFNTTLNPMGFLWLKFNDTLIFFYTESLE